MMPALLRYFFIVDTPIDNLLDYKTRFINLKGGLWFHFGISIVGVRLGLNAGLFFNFL